MNGTDHFNHGLSMLALKYPEIRPHMRNPAVGEEVREMCEHYSMAVIHLRKLRRGAAGPAKIDEVLGIMAELEREVVRFVREFAKLM